MLSTNFPDRQTIKKNGVRSLKLVYLLLIPSVFVIIIISEWLLSAFGVNYVTNAKILLWLLSVSSLFLGFTGVYTSILKSQDRLKELIWITGSSSLLVLVFSYFLISYWGITCIGFIWLGVQGIMSIVLVFRLLYWLKH